MAKEIETMVVSNLDAAYGRSGYLKLVGNKVVFDDSDEEYGPCEFPISKLIEAIEEHYNLKIEI